MKKLSKEYYWELAQFCMDYHGGQWSRGRVEGVGGISMARGQIDKENAPVKFTTQKGSQYSVGESGTIYRDKFDGRKYKANKIGFVSKEYAEKILSLPKQYEEVIKVIHEQNKVKFITDYTGENQKTIFEAPISTIPKVGLYPIEGLNLVPHLGDVITSVSTPTPAVSETITPAAEVTPAEQVEMPKDFEITGKK